MRGIYFNEVICISIIFSSSVKHLPFDNNLDIYTDKAVYSVNVDESSGNVLKVKQTRRL